MRVRARQPAQVRPIPGANTREEKRHGRSILFLLGLLPKHRQCAKREQKDLHLHELSRDRRFTTADPW
jgi:hypothetical protein